MWGVEVGSTRANPRADRRRERGGAARVTSLVVECTSFKPMVSAAHSGRQPISSSDDETRFDSADPTLRRIVDTIVEALDPEQVILFGSRARGEASAHSDYDVCVIVEPNEHRRDLVRRIHGLFDVRGFSMDAFVLSPDELREQREIVNTLGYIVARDGEVLYERS